MNLIKSINKVAKHSHPVFVITCYLNEWRAFLRQLEASILYICFEHRFDRNAFCLGKILVLLQSRYLLSHTQNQEFKSPQDLLKYSSIFGMVDLTF